MTSSEAAQPWQDYQESAKSAFGSGDYVEAERLWSLAVAEAEKLGTEDPRRLRSLVDLAKLYHAQCKYPEAEPLLKTALEITEKIAGQSSPSVAVILNNLGALYHAQSRHNDAEGAYRRALSIAINAYGPFHLSVANAFNNLAELYRSQGLFLYSEPMYRYVLAIYEFHDPSSLSMVVVLNNLAFLLVTRGKYEEAKALLERVLALEKPGTNAPFFQQMRVNYAELVKRTDRGILHWLRKPFNKA